MGKDLAPSTLKTTVLIQSHIEKREPMKDMVYRKCEGANRSKEHTERCLLESFHRNIFGLSLRMGHNEAKYEKPQMGASAASANIADESLLQRRQTEQHVTIMDGWMDVSWKADGKPLEVVYQPCCLSEMNPTCAERL
ncbi:cardiac-enriched FHL2-interacting protein isoform X2 [Tiliqua scincoides]|uniref:cardiac-enriched FHL2-interacting protein isoform X2 n=1 Tax=Tiliqua scincoides TaxID=71010 RepID=UPI003461F67B